MYALIDPITQFVRYVGQSSVGPERAYRHGVLARTSRGTHNRHLTNWIRKLQSVGLNYEVEILESGFETQGDLNEAEQFWANYLRAIGSPLINIRECGGARGRHSEETKRLMSLNNGMKRPEVRNRFAGDNNPSRRPDVREKKSAAIKAAMSRPDVRERHLAAMNDEWRGKIAKAMAGRVYSDETIRKISESKKGKKFTPEHCANISAARKRMFAARKAAKPHE